MTINTTVVEVHGNDGASHLTAAKNHVLKNEGDVEILDAAYGAGRCEHGDLLVTVTYQAKGKQ